MTPKFKSFEASVLYFNGMYKLPVSPTPSLAAEQEWQNKTFGLNYDRRAALLKRMDDFFAKILTKEIAEHEDIRDKAFAGAAEIDLLVDMADLLGDIQVYCASEMARLGLPNAEVLRIIMDSNFSKLGEDGNPIYDEDGKVCKGPGYWKPEPEIKKFLLNIISEG